MKYQIGDRIRFRGRAGYYSSLFDLDEILEGIIKYVDTISTLQNDTGEYISLGECYLVESNNINHIVIGSNIIERVIDLNDIEYYVK